MTELPVFSNSYDINNEFTKKLFGYSSKMISIDTLIPIFVSLISFFWVYKLLLYITITIFRTYYQNRVSNSKLVFNISLIFFILWLMLIPLLAFSLVGVYGLLIIPLMLIKLLLSNNPSFNFDELTIKIDQSIEELQKNEKNVKIKIAKIDTLLTYKTILSKVKNNTGNLNLSYTMFNLIFIFDKYFNLNETKIDLLEKEFTQIYKYVALLR